MNIAYYILTLSFLVNISGAIINQQATSTITQTNVKVLQTAPAIAMGNLYIPTSQALANADNN